MPDGSWCCVPCNGKDLFDDIEHAEKLSAARCLVLSFSGVFAVVIFDFISLFTFNSPSFDTTTDQQDLLAQIRGHLPIIIGAIHTALLASTGCLHRVKPEMDGTLAKLKEAEVPSSAAVALVNSAAAQFLQERSFRRLEAHVGEDALSMLEQGQSGIARGYEDDHRK
ncbi:hypothetical protein DFH07DRAFT_1016403 [Mycena maculata]|uniref:Uncharacterized protein n=1 Tax=Mycena maculata TaxID=230809 RepID=A0AAD7NKC2_9AGAR|nr:hypothetical protein DFH07DRAFT_1016403 [Mycena maculata]